MLKSIVTDLESVPVAAREYYAETEDGRYVLDVEPVDGLALQTVDGLKTALSSERMKHRSAVAALRAAEERLEQFGDLDPTAARAALARVTAGPVTDIEAAVAARVEGMRSSIAEAAGADAKIARSERDALQETLARREKQLQRVTRDNLIQSELARVKPLADAVDALVLMSAQHVVMVEEEGELVARVIDRRGDPRLTEDGKPLSVRAFMTEMRNSRPALFEPTLSVQGLGTGQSSSSASSTSGRPGESNPWARGTVNITQQVAMAKRDPARAVRLRAEAGA